MWVYVYPRILGFGNFSPVSGFGRLPLVDVANVIVKVSAVFAPIKWVIGVEESVCLLGKSH